MHASAVLVSLLATAAASPLAKRIIAQEFDVSDFSAGCTPHGSGCSIFFRVATNQMPYATDCSATITQAANELPDVPFTACADASVIFSFRAIGLSGAAASNYTLLLADAQQSVAAAKIWDAAEFPIKNDGSSVHQQFVGTSRFVVQ